MPAGTARPVRKDLDGAPAVHAAFMRAGVCACGDLIGVDLLDREQETIAHGHLDIDQAREFLAQFSEAIEEAEARKNPQ